MLGHLLEDPMTAVYGKHGGIFSNEPAQNRTFMLAIYIEK
jgi:hypothetical protein